MTDDILQNTEVARPARPHPKSTTFFLSNVNFVGIETWLQRHYMQVVRCIFVKYMGILINLLSFPYFYQKNANSRILNQIVDRFSQDSPAQWKRRMCAPVVCRRNWRMQLAQYDQLFQSALQGIPMPL